MDKILFYFLYFFGIIMLSYERPSSDFGGTTPIDGRSIALYKLRLTAVPTSLPELAIAFGQLMQEVGKMEVESMITNSLLITRSWTDDIEDVFNAEFNFPSQEDMLKILKNPNSKNKFLINIDHETQYLSPNSTPKKNALELNSFDRFTNIHPVKWLYYIMFCTSNYAERLRSILTTNNIKVLELCNWVGKIHEISTAIHKVSSAMSAQQIIDGLMLNGIDIDKTSITQYVYLMIEMKRNPRLYEGTLTTLKI